MQIIFEDLKDKVCNKLEKAVSATIAVAYFRPDEYTLRILKQIPQLKIIVSKEFDKNDPYKLEEIASSSTISETRCMPVFPNRIHAKVIYGENRDGNSFAFVGSANITYDGFSQNREATIMLESSIENDRPILKNISNWLTALWDDSSEIDFAQAKIIFDRTTHVGMPAGAKPSHVWAIKTRDGRASKADDYWNLFQSEGVIGLGWGGDLGIDPRTTDLNKLRGILLNKYRLHPTKAGRVAREITQFAGKDNGIQINDIVWVIGGFSPNQKQPVDIYGVAKVTCDLLCDWQSAWWNYKRVARISVVGRSIDISKARTCFGKQAMTETLYRLKDDCSEKLCSEIKRVHGITLHI